MRLPHVLILTGFSEKSQKKESRAATSSAITPLGVITPGQIVSSQDETKSVVDYTK
jgi:hypothetical protein